MQFLQGAKQSGQQLPPQGVQTILGRMDAMLQAMEQVDNNGGKQLRVSVEEYLKTSGYIPNPQQPQVQNQPAVA
jgi:hypothetical protein